MTSKFSPSSFHQDKDVNHMYKDDKDTYQLSVPLQL